jgi:hypothetical protein
VKLSVLSFSAFLIFLLFPATRIQAATLIQTSFNSTETRIAQDSDDSSSSSDSLDSSSSSDSSTSESNSGSGRTFHDEHGNTTGSVDSEGNFRDEHGNSTGSVSGN